MRWAPAGTRPRMRPTNQADTPANSGTPCGPVLQAVAGPKRSAPLRANTEASASWWSPSMCTPTWDASATAGQLEALAKPLAKNGYGQYLLSLLTHGPVA